MHTIFVIHGMGEFEDGWDTDFEKVIREEYERYETTKTFDELYAVSSLSYDVIFRDYLTRLGNRNERFQLVDEIVRMTGNDLAKAVFKSAQLDPDDEFLYTHVADVLFYTVTNLAGRVITDVQNQLETKLKALGDSATWSIVAHSLGTRVIHDVLQSEYTRPDFRRAYGKPACLLQLSNVSRLTEVLIEGDIYNSAVIPAEETSRGACASYINAHHALDPFTLPHPFKPPIGWPTGQPNDLYIDIPIPAEETIEKNVHSFATYMRNPRVSRPFFNWTYDVPGVLEFIDETKFNQELTQFLGTTLPGNLRNLIDTLKDLTKDPINNWDQIVESWTKVKKLIKEFEG